MDNRVEIQVEGVVVRKDHLDIVDCIFDPVPRIADLGVVVVVAVAVAAVAAAPAVSCTGSLLLGPAAKIAVGSLIGPHRRRHLHCLASRVASLDFRIDHVHSRDRQHHLL